jgi:hypothetical protein
MRKTYSFEVIDFAHTTHRFRSSNNRNCLDRDLVTETGALAIYNTRHEDVSLYTILLPGFDNLVVRPDSLRTRH